MSGQQSVTSYLVAKCILIGTDAAETDGCHQPTDQDEPVVRVLEVGLQQVILPAVEDSLKLLESHKKKSS